MATSTAESLVTAVAKAGSDAVEGLKAELSDAKSEVRRLTDIIVSMKRDGFQPPPIPESFERAMTQAMENDLPNAVLDALDEIGLTGAQLEQHKDWARRRLRREKNAEIVAEELLAGGLVMEEQAE